MWLKAVVVAVLMGAGANAAAEPWWDRLQIWGMLPLPVANAEALHLTVNGMLGGFSEVTSVRLETLAGAYESDEAYVEACHAAGMKVGGYVPGVEGRSDWIEANPELKQAQCMDFAGRPAMYTDYELYLCPNNPIWHDWLVARGKKIIDAGGDVIFFDAPQGSTFSLLSWLRRPGFCEHCQQGFRAYLKDHVGEETLREQYGIEDLAAFDFRLWLVEEDLLAADAEMEEEVQVTNPPAAAGEAPEVVRMSREMKFRTHPLVVKYMEYQIEENAAHKAAIISAWREHAAATGQEIVIGTNQAELNVGSLLGPGGFTGLEIAELQDFFFYEVLLKPIWPKGKSVGYFRLAQGILDRRPVALPSWGGGMIQSNNTGTPMDDLHLGMFMEAYALGGSQAVYQDRIDEDYPGGVGPLYRKTATASKYLLDNRDLFEGLESAAQTAIYFQYRPLPQLYGHSYLGLAQALAEAEIDFDVLVQGDGRYIKRQVDDGALQRYKLVYAVSLQDTPEAERKLLRDYVTRGGTLVTFDPAELEIPTAAGRHEVGKGAVIVLPRKEEGLYQKDPAWLYYDSYAAEHQQTLVAPALALEARVLEVMPASREVIGYSYHQPELDRLVCHLVNYDYVEQGDILHQHENLRVRVMPPEGLKLAGSAVLRGLDHPGEVVLELAEDHAVTVPALKYHAAVTFPLEATE